LAILFASASTVSVPKAQRAAWKKKRELFQLESNFKLVLILARVKSALTVAISTDESQK
jgi:hypothetical protein